MISELQDHPAATFPFLKLPLEVRNMVYHLLLTTPKPLGTMDEDGDLELLKFSCDEPSWARWGHYHLHPAILRVCKQLQKESSMILYEENTVGIAVWYAVGEIKIGIMNIEHHTNFAKSSRSTNAISAPVKCFKRFQIILDACSIDSLVKIQSLHLALSSLCSLYLNEIAMQHLSLRLFSNSSRNIYITLKAFAVLRNVRSVAIHGVPAAFGANLGRLMVGNSPQGELERMLGALEEYVENFDGFDNELDSAHNAIEELNVPLFTQIRSEIVSAVRKLMDEALFRLYAHDPKTSTRSEMGFPRGFRRERLEWRMER